MYCVQGRYDWELERICYSIKSFNSRYECKSWAISKNMEKRLEAAEYFSPSFSYFFRKNDMDINGRNDDKLRRFWRRYD